MEHNTPPDLRKGMWYELDIVTYNTPTMVEVNRPPYQPGNLTTVYSTDHFVTWTLKTNIEF